MEKRPMEAAGSQVEREGAERSLRKRALEAAERYLERLECTILDVEWTSPSGEVADIVAIDPTGTVTITEVAISRGSELPEMEANAEKQRRAEKLAIDYLMSHEFEDGTAIRFDAISIVVVKEGEAGFGRALLKHERGCFNRGFAA